jgi:hypothetical protein
MSNPLIYDVNMSTRALIDHLQRGETVCCPRCGAELMAALDRETAAKLKVHLGIYCPHSVEHVQVYIEAGATPGFWDQFKK